MGEGKAVLAGGCFWCLEAAFKRLPGVMMVESGYSGGSQADPTYEQVCSGQTGHAEAVRISFDPGEISFLEILDFFWKIHDPTTENRQGADIGEQYRSVIFYLDESQHTLAEDSRNAHQAKLNKKIVTSIEAAGKFWPAEEYHQDYYRHNADAPYCRFVIAPKLKKAGL